ncbi:ATP-dependent protease [Verticillium dahliae VdLs.17]|uniref:ATP-dependent protease n=1 Tax=Verticillium dahliae (strain VdLs.17 / ATCC MYA-4575 / FGSC 10137) TaxID=498257 RepID=G2X924_VERDV|nr:ATP-dependent protease [Verticillium dahliae VdLs.17]EGY15492.1 ATP-dependent protease [Verticillium dahliae VdLs.17]KAF3342679.1 High mobility group protein 1 [Verticillium dahliae VDG2]KAH6687561.1 ATP-dependent protease [Verticillium dahliae]
MSSETPEAFESRPSDLTSHPAHEADGEKSHGTTSKPILADQVRAVIRLIQCRKCSYPLNDPVTLPCGRSLCRECLPESRTREHISYPATPARLQGFDCPFPECGKQHALSDTSADVVLSKAIEHFRNAILQGQSLEALDSILTNVSIQDEDERAVAGLSSMAERNHKSTLVRGGKLVATYTLAEQGELKYAAEVSFAEVSLTGDEAALVDEAVFMQVKESVRTEMDCQVCYALFYDPLTTVCGHTFCRSCLHRVLDHSLYCPISAEALNRHREFDIPVFVCTLAFPMMPTFLHIFEPRYRLMIRHDAPFVEYGTLLRIVNAEYFPDGRSLIETIGISRFKVVRHGVLDGYMVGKIDRIDDVSIAEEEELEVQELQHSSLQRVASNTSQQSGSGTPPRVTTTTEDLARMPTRDLLDFAVSFVQRMSQQSVPWLAQRILTIYGECPVDAAQFPWWFASILPAKEPEKYRLLGTQSVRERLKICCAWVLEWEANRW